MPCNILEIIKNPLKYIFFFFYLYIPITYPLLYKTVLSIPLMDKDVVLILDFYKHMILSILLVSDIFAVLLHPNYTNFLV
jgi:hypothetical protein